MGISLKFMEVSKLVDVSPLCWVLVGSHTASPFKSLESPCAHFSEVAQHSIASYPEVDFPTATVQHTRPTSEGVNNML